MSELDALQRLYGDEGKPVDEPIRKRPQIGDEVRVGDLPERFTVIDRDGGLYTLESQRGARCRAGVLVVRLADEERAA